MKRQEKKFVTTDNALANILYILLSLRGQYNRCNLIGYALVFGVKHSQLHMWNIYLETDKKYFKLLSFR